MTTTYTIDQLTAAGGKLWQKHGRRRVYFNDLPRRYGVRTNHYKSGNISSATLDGEGISNSAARGILQRLQDGKLWYDLDADGFRSRDLDADDEDTLIAAVVREIDSRE